MCLINILAFLILVIAIAYKFDTDAVKAWPFATCILVLFLFIPAFFSKLSAIDFVGAVIFFAAAAFIIVKRNDAQVTGRLRKIIFNPSFAAAVIFMIVILVAVSAKPVTWWDEINFWASDSKSIFALDGYAGKYGNVSPEFGDYPPAASLIKYWFLHMFANEFDEGIMFMGYYFLLFSFLVPVFSLVPLKSEKVTKTKAVFLYVGVGVVLLLLLSCVEGFWCDGSCMDTVIGVIFGLFCICVTGKTDKPLPNECSVHESLPSECGPGKPLPTPYLHYIKCGLLLAVMVICKDSANLWLAFAIMWAVIYEFVLGNRKIKGLLVMAAIPVITMVSWIAYCLINRRIAGHTTTLASMATGKMSIPGFDAKVGEVFAQAFLKYPLHRYTNGILNLSPLTLIVLLVAVAVLLGVFGKITKKESMLLAVFTLGSAGMVYFFILVCHMTIFLLESQYQEPFAMVSSIERYGAIYSVGVFIFILYILLKKTNSKWVFAAVAVFVLLTADYQGTYRAFIGYRTEKTKTIEDRAEVLGGDEREFVNTYCNGDDFLRGRILVLHDNGDYSTVRDAYFSYEASPVALIHKYTDISNTSEEMQGEWFALARENHADYIYVNSKLYEVPQVPE